MTSTLGGFLFPVINFRVFFFFIFLSPVSIVLVIPLKLYFLFSCIFTLIFVLFSSACHSTNGPDQLPSMNDSDNFKKNSNLKIKKIASFLLLFVMTHVWLAGWLQYMGRGEESAGREKQERGKEREKQ